MSQGFLPICKKDMEERGWEQLDFVYISGDAYVDHPSFGPAVITRLLEDYGYKVGIIAQPDWKDKNSITVLGEPRLAFLVSAGNMDSMVNHYSVSKRRRSTDAYTPGGVMGKRPDYAVTVYGNLIRQVYKKTPIILGGIEASLRRLAHYDYWSNKLKRSVLWDSWADENGSIGKAYGYQLGVKYKFPHGEMDQVDNVLWQLKNTPASRRIMTNIYNFADLTEMGLEPCAYSMTFNVTGNRLNGILNQRSQDTLTANNWNVVQYSALLMMFAQVSGLEPGELVHVISDMHIYDRHIDMVKTMLDREPLPAPKVRLNPEVKNFYDFTVDDFIVEDYEYGKSMGRVPVAI